MKSHEKNLSPECKAKLRATLRPAAAASTAAGGGNTCQNEGSSLCGQTSAGTKERLDCLVSHNDQISPLCQKAAAGLRTAVQSKRAASGK
jgi:hypothetical protein